MLGRAKNWSVSLQIWVTTLTPGLFFFQLLKMVWNSHEVLRESFLRKDFALKKGRLFALQGEALVPLSFLMYPFCSWLANLMISLPMHWAKAVFPLFKELGGAAAALTSISSSFHALVACQWELGWRYVENANKKANLLYHPWVSQAKECFTGVYSGGIQSLCNISWELLTAEYGALPGSLSATCVRDEVFTTWWLCSYTKQDMIS